MKRSSRQDLSQQMPSGANASGNQSLVPFNLIQRALPRQASAQIYACAGAAIALGLAAGVAIALTVSSSAVYAGAAASAPQISQTQSVPVHAAVLNAMPAVYAAMVSMPDTKPGSGGQSAASAGKATSESQVLTLTNAPSDTKPSGSQPAAGPKKHHMHKLWNWKKASARHNGHRKPYVSPNAQAANQPDPPTALERATAAAATGPFFVGIEGDVTVASYDVASNRIQTYEGSNFLVDKAAASGGAIHWQDFPFNVHYRCNETGNCTLMRGGAAEIARLTR